MPFASNAHTHTTWCDGRDTVREMVDAAAALGFVSLGFSGHASQGFDFDYSMSPEAQKAYFAEIRVLQREPLPLRLWAGLEIDALAGENERTLAREADYRIGSTHYLTAEPGGDSIAVDGDPEQLRTYVDTAFSGDGLAMVRHFFDITCDSLLAARPEVIGHFDLVRKYAERLSLFDASGPAYRHIALDALERAFPCGAVLEVNTGGMARGYLPTPYPMPELLCAWREMGGRVTITSDCHDKRYLTYGFDTAQTILKEAGFKSVLRLGTGSELWEEISI